MHGSYSVATCDDSIVLLYGILFVVYFENMNGAVVVVACYTIYMFVPGFEISGLYFTRRVIWGPDII